MRAVIVQAVDVEVDDVRRTAFFQLAEVRE